ncbi:hypothetical protein Y1Q_0011604 [Alligator mississippiensis]|uniref:Uncharacterized protein n=1 Tax=Alligator mississippiensis TaxID=8496 RepID=A0A151M0F0_ALLMI|nr:hypothetical protein Y1Q_0011604 [Alligator mississippiensis]
MLVGKGHTTNHASEKTLKQKTQKGPSGFAQETKNALQDLLWTTVKGPGAACRDEVILGSHDAASWSPPRTARALWMHWLLQMRTLDRNLLLNHMVTALEDQLEDAWALWAEDMACQDSWWVEDVVHKV